MTVEEATKPPVEIWPAHVEVAKVFDRMQSQWVTTMAGVFGFNYASLPVVFDALRIPRERLEDVFDDLRVMEVTAVRKMREMRERNKK